MQLALLYFASLRERVGCSAETAEVPDTVRTVLDLRAWLQERGGEWHVLGAPSTQCAVNQMRAAPATALSDGDEVAFFPPVTGG